MFLCHFAGNGMRDLSVPADQVFGQRETHVAEGAGVGSTQQIVCHAAFDQVSAASSSLTIKRIFWWQGG